MLEHHIQKAIIYKLAFSPGLRFSELKPDDLDNKLFDYHLKLVIRAGLVEKNETGLYTLTSEGRRVGVGVLDKQFMALDRAHSVLFLIVRRRSDNAWLLTRRQTHPLLDQVGFVHANPTADKAIFQIATDELRAKTGLQANFRYIGSGYFTIYEDDELESYTHFTALAADDVTGDLKQIDAKNKYFWQENIDAISDNLLPTAKALIKCYESGQPFFVEETFEI